MHNSMPRASLVTPLGEGGIGVIVLSGPNAAIVLGRVFRGTRRSAAGLTVGRIAHGTIRARGHTLDEVIIARLPDGEGGRFEINCHGGVVAVRAVLNALAEAGANVVPWRDSICPRGTAPPLSPRSLRELASSLLPSARTRLAATVLLHQTNGALDRALGALQRHLAGRHSAPASRALRRLLSTAEFGKALLHPPRVALLGPPNAGKSTLLNALLNRERVIVHSEPGTTRDVVSELLGIRGMPFQVMDAAGIRDTADELEREAVRRARELACSCDIALLVFDLSQGGQALRGMPRPAACVRAITVGNKSDLAPGVSAAQADVRVSALKRRNLESLEAALLAPYVQFIEPAISGAAIVFHEAVEEHLQAVRERLDHSTEEAARELQALREGEN